MSKEKEEQKDYTKYQFAKDEKLDIPADLMANVARFMNNLLEQEGIGCQWITEPRYEYVHVETGEPAKPNTPQDKLKSEYRKILSVGRTLNAQPVQNFTNTGKTIMYFLEQLSQVQMENVDNGKGFIPEPEEDAKLEKVE